MMKNTDSHTDNFRAIGMFCIGFTISSIGSKLMTYWGWW